MEHADDVLHTTFILDTLRQPDSRGDPGIVAVHVRRLRLRLARGGRHLRTVRGIVYIFEARSPT